MREILFRGKTTKDKEWVYGDLLHDGYDYDVAIWEQKYKLVTEISLESIGQFTGMTDKNSKKIFDGDAVRVSNDYFCRDFVCRWDEPNVEFMLANKHESFGLGYVAPYEVEVIGNIHDNPELVEVS